MNADRLQSQIRHWIERPRPAVACREVVSLPIALGTDVGLRRVENQDFAAALQVHEAGEAFVVAAVCDGMGGMADGAGCAALAIATFFTRCILDSEGLPEPRLASAANAANRAVYCEYKGLGGATLSAVMFTEKGELAGINIGDSRIYVVERGSLNQLSVDDTPAGRWPRPGGTPMDSHGLLQFAGIGEGCEPFTVRFPDRSVISHILLSTDGLHGTDPDTLRSVIVNGDSILTILRRLMSLASWCGGIDNATGILATGFDRLPGARLGDTGVTLWDPNGELRIGWDGPLR